MTRRPLLLALSLSCLAHARPAVPASALLLCEASGFSLAYAAAEGPLQLTNLNAKQRELPFHIDFESARALARCRGALSELVVRAVGRSGGASVLDFTAGIGRDSLLLACAGHNVVMVERNEVLQLLLADALARLCISNPALASRLSLVRGDARHQHTLATATSPASVVYLDPMYPANEVGRRASVKKDTQVLHSLLGDSEGVDEDNNRLLFERALESAAEKVVVKRPLNAQNLASAIPHSSVKGSTHRFDVYLKTSPIRYSM